MRILKTPMHGARKTGRPMQAPARLGYASFPNERYPHSGSGCKSSGGFSNDFGGTKHQPGRYCVKRGIDGMKLRFLLGGVVALALLISAPNSLANGGGGHGGGGGGHGGGNFHGGGF